MKTTKIFDILGIGIGPFNLGLAALALDIPGLQCLFIDQQECFNWHPGLMLDNARLQVPFLADLVTLANPQSRFSYLAFLHANQRLFRFAIHENYFPTRREYNAYCRWVVGQLPSLLFGRTCTSVCWNEADQFYEIQVTVNSTRAVETFHAKHLVIGTGTIPSMPTCAHAIHHPLVIHSSNYLFNRKQLRAPNNITIIGSGQSAAEIFDDLLGLDHLEQLNWFTHATRFFPMEYSKLTLEMTSTDYIDYFFQLPPEKKKWTLQQQDALYKGINFSLINSIYDRLYLNSLEEGSGTAARLVTHCDLQGMTIDADNRIRLQLLHTGTGQFFEQVTGAVILATGYKQVIPSFLQPLTTKIEWTEDGLYKVKRDYSIDKGGKSIFVQNADLHTHGFNSADLGMGPYRNAAILNTILSRPHFNLERGIAFQHFGVPTG